MRIPLLLIASLLAAGGCAAITADPLPVCDGRTRRPANPYGSVLAPPSPTAPETATDISTPAGGAPGGCA
ncbi:hypothetical protein [Brevundimonas sp. NPDC046655]|uniref:hypothetical protein n=1 Tax=unclassified Brevundimonas TaxID=2622653 RepID=UPI003850C428